jgi:hypothetical protein
VLRARRHPENSVALLVNLTAVIGVIVDVTWAEFQDQLSVILDAVRGARGDGPGSAAGIIPVLFLEGANFIVAVRWFGIGEKDQAEIADLDFVASG